MVDINLLGDEEEKSPQEENETDNDFSDTYSDDSEELTAEQGFGDSDELDQSIYGAYDRGSSRKAIFILAGIIIVAAISVGAYFMFGTQKKQPQTIDQPVVETQIKEPETKPQTEVPVEDATPTPPAVEVPGYVNEMSISTQHGVRTIETILSTIPQDIKFTLIQYRDGNFLSEVLGNSSSKFATLANQLKQRMSNGDVKIISQDTRRISGRAYQQALINGNVLPDGTSTVQFPSILSVNEVKAAFAQYCNQLDLSLKEFDVKSTINAGNYLKAPVIFKATGKKDAALNFLNRIIEQNINVNLSKIVFIASPRSFDNQNINLRLNLEIYTPQ